MQKSWYGSYTRTYLNDTEGPHSEEQFESLAAHAWNVISIDVIHSVVSGCYIMLC